MPRSDIHAVLFDKDGTLLHFDASWRPALLRAADLASNGEAGAGRAGLLGATGFDATTGRVATGSIIGAGNTRDIAAAWAAAGAALDEAGLIAALDEIFATAMHDAVPIEGLGPALAALRAHGYVLGVASSDSEAAIRTFLEVTGLGAEFDFVVGYDSGHGHKPEPGMLAAFCRAVAVAPAQVAMVGDNPQDLEMARRAGAGLKVGVLTGNSASADLAPLADLILPGRHRPSGRARGTAATPVP